VIEALIQRHEEYLDLILKKTQIPAQRVREAIHYSLFPGGKRIRPILVYLIGDLLHINRSILDAIAAAVELTHCYSLVHDDLPAMDDDDLRRGKLSCHKAYDEATAILVGDGMQALAIELLLTHLTHLLNPSQIVEMTRVLVQASGISGMVSGQSLDLSELTQSSISEEQLKEIHLLKTGRLILACVDMVLAASNSSDEQVSSALRTYAKHLGLVFQMQDDYLDYYAPSEILGKARSSDLANKKNTFASLLNRQTLEADIAAHYHIALKSLTVFDTKAIALVELTQTIQRRSRLCS
jgi:farnesyl diphosphate synthase